eukprot:2429297-Lingulodinium_polyedra.AAC.1
MERARFRSAEATLARQHALRAAGFVEDSSTGRWRPLTLGEDCWEVDSSFPEIPARLLRAEQWEPRLWGQWLHPEGILVLEARALCMALKRIGVSVHGGSTRQLCLVDNMSLCLAVSRWRSSNHAIIRILRRLAAYALSRDLRILVRWVP